MTAIPVAARERMTFDRQRAVAGIFVMLGLVDIFVFGFLADKGDAVFTFTLTGAAVSVPNLSLAPGPVSEAFGALSILLGFLYAERDPDQLSPWDVVQTHELRGRMRQELERAKEFLAGRGRALSGPASPQRPPDAARPIDELTGQGTRRAV